MIAVADVVVLAVLVAGVALLRKADNMGVGHSKGKGQRCCRRCRCRCRCYFLVDVLSGGTV